MHSFSVRFDTVEEERRSTHWSLSARNRRAEARWREPPDRDRNLPVGISCAIEEYECLEEEIRRRTDECRSTTPTKDWRPQQRWKVNTEFPPGMFDRSSRCWISRRHSDLFWSGFRTSSAIDGTRNNADVKKLVSEWSPSTTRRTWHERGNWSRCTAWMSSWLTSSMPWVTSEWEGNRHSREWGWRRESMGVSIRLSTKECFPDWSSTRDTRRSLDDILHRQSNNASLPELKQTDEQPFSPTSKSYWQRERPEKPAVRWFAHDRAKASRTSHP